MYILKALDREIHQEWGSLSVSLSLRGVSRIKLDPSSLEETESPDNEREVGKELVKEPVSLLLK
jgi:hypothetical protein